MGLDDEGPVRVRPRLPPDRATDAVRFLEETPTRLSIHVLCMVESVVPFQGRLDPCRGISRTLGKYPLSGRFVRFLTSLSSKRERQVNG